MVPGITSVVALLLLVGTPASWAGGLVSLLSPGSTTVTYVNNNKGLVRRGLTHSPHKKRTWWDLLGRPAAFYVSVDF